MVLEKCFKMLCWMQKFIKILQKRKKLVENALGWQSAHKHTHTYEEEQTTPEILLFYFIPFT